MLKEVLRPHTSKLSAGLFTQKDFVCVAENNRVIFNFGNVVKIYNHTLTAHKKTVICQKIRTSFVEWDAQSYRFHGFAFGEIITNRSLAQLRLHYAVVCDFYASAFGFYKDVLVLF